MKSTEQRLEEAVVSRMMEIAGPSVRERKQIILEKYYHPSQAPAPVKEEVPPMDMAPEEEPMPEEPGLDTEVPEEGGEEDVVARLLTTIAQALSAETGVAVDVETEEVPGEEEPVPELEPEVPAEEEPPVESIVDEDAQINEMAIKVAEKLIELMGKYKKESSAPPAAVEAKTETKTESKEPVKTPVAESKETPKTAAKTEKPAATQKKK